MKKILFINACVRPESRTHGLVEYLLGKLSGEVEEVNLEKEELLPLNNERLTARNAWVAAGDFSAPMFRFAKQFAKADEIVIAAPYWDLQFPALLKLYFEAVTVTGLTFRYTEEGYPESLCRAKRLIYITTAGGPVMDWNFGFDYIHALSKGFYGIEDVICVKAENLDVIGADVPGILEQAKKDIDDAVKEAL